MWHKFLSPTRFTSSDRSGKWLFDVDRSEADSLFEIIEDAVMADEIPAAKRASPNLEMMLEPGRTILLAYTREKAPAAVAEALAHLRRRGLASPGHYKDDMATILRRDAVAYLSSDFEESGKADPTWPGAGEVALFESGTCIDLVLTGTGADGIPWGVGHEMDHDTDWEDTATDGRLLVPAFRNRHRDNLIRTDLRKTVRVLGSPDWSPPVEGPRANPR